MPLREALYGDEAALEVRDCFEGDSLWLLQRYAVMSQVPKFRGKRKGSAQKGSCKNYFTNFMQGPGHLWNRGLFVKVSWNGVPVGN